MSPPFPGKGFTLIEVLFSLGILTTGLLGMTALQREALQYTHAALLDSQAQLLINDMLERIRANQFNSAYAIGFSQNTPSSTTDCASSLCTTNQMAAWDIAQWRGKVEDSRFLPGGESQIVLNSGNRQIEISIRYQWSQLSGKDSQGSQRSLSVSTRIQ